MVHPVRRLLAIIVVAMLTAAEPGWSQKPEQPTTDRFVLVTGIEGAIGPATARQVAQAIESAEERRAEILVLRMDTPGGLATSMRAIIRSILGANVPVVGFVAPPGAHAASAGTYMLYATHIAAMAPATNLGAATPVQIGGGFPGGPGPDRKPDREDPADGKEDGSEDAGKDRESKPAAPGDAMSRKAINDAVAFIRGLAEMHGRNAEWAEKAVREAASLSAAEAKQQNVIDLVADDLSGLIAAVDGWQVRVRGESRTLATKDLPVERFEPGLLTRALGILSNPNVALILMMIGVYGLIFEFANPGSFGPGVVGVICLVLGLYALNQLPFNYAGLALLILGLAFMVAEAFTPTFGVLGTGGLVAFVIGAAMLIDTDVPAFQVSWWMIGIMAALSGILLILVVGWVWRAHRHPTVDSVSRLAGMQAEVIEWSGDDGRVWAEGEVWNARGAAGLSAGDRVMVRARDGLTLVVEADRSPGQSPGGPASQQQGA